MLTVTASWFLIFHRDPIARNRLEESFNVTVPRQNPKRKGIGIVTNDFTSRTFTLEHSRLKRFAQKQVSFFDVLVHGAISEILAM